MNNENSARRAGDRDTTFGIDGEVTLSILPDSILYTRRIDGALVLPDNGTLLSTTLETRDGFGQFGLVRLTADGSLDRSFGNDGLLIDFFKGEEACGGGRLLRLADGRLLSLGYSVVYDGENPFAHLAMACYSGDYKLDKTFGERGTGHLVIENKPDEIYIQASGKVAQQADGKLLICTTYQKLGNWRNTVGVLYRLHANGTFDKTFNRTGRLDFRLLDPAAPTALYACLPQADGKFVVAGHGYLQPVRETALIARFDDKGVLDTEFGHRNSPGYFSIGVDNRPTQFNDLLSTTRGFVGLGQVGATAELTTEGMLVGITKDGEADLQFNEGKPVLTQYKPDKENAWFCGYVQPDGKLVTTAARHYIYVSRWLDNGSADSEFGNAGYITEDSSNSGDLVILAPRTENRILWAGNPTGVQGGMGKLFSYLG